MWPGACLDLYAPRSLFLPLSERVVLGRVGGWSCASHDWKEERGSDKTRIDKTRKERARLLTLHSFHSADV